MNLFYLFSIQNGREPPTRITRKQDEGYNIVDEISRPSVLIMEIVFHVGFRIHSSHMAYPNLKFYMYNSKKGFYVKPCK